MTPRRTILAASLALVVLSLAGPAAAHAGGASTGGFVAGFLHSLTGPDHLLAMVAVGIWGAFLGRPLVVALPVIFPAMMATGGVLAMAGVPFPPVELGVQISVILLGLVIAFRYRAPIWLACAIVALFGAFHGYAHGLSLPTAADPIGYSAGFMLATGSLHIVGIALGLLRDRKGGEISLRVVGGLIAAAGGLFITGVIVP